MKISLVVITKNEEANIASCIQSCPFVDEVIVVDSGSSDRTEEICKSLGAKFIFNAWPGYGKQKQFAIEQARNNWILSLDADEYLTPELSEEISRALEFNKEAYRIPRKQIFMGTICHYGKSVDHPVRLFNRERGSFDLKNIHESFISTGPVGDLHGFMMHNSGITVFERCKKIMRDLELEIQNNSDPSIGVNNVMFDPIRYFLSYYIKHQGYKDGVAGYVMTALFSIQMFLQNAAQFEKNLKNNRLIK
ncbi:MAG: glycosyltransferase family 2 protein [Bacteriovoracaceae bacterium]|nr:glycosyltransferase family 2 protein [Bacteriovoracaceae bacterium]